MKLANAHETVKAMEYVVQWECLPGFPRTDAGILTLARAMASMCPLDRMEWLSNRVLNGVNKCPTPLELRRIATVGKGSLQHHEIVDGLETEDVDVEYIAEGNWD